MVLTHMASIGLCTPSRNPCTPLPYHVRLTYLKCTLPAIVHAFSIPVGDPLQPCAPFLPPCVFPHSHAHPAQIHARPFHSLHLPTCMPLTLRFVPSWLLAGQGMYWGRALHISTSSPVVLCPGTLL